MVRPISTSGLAGGRIYLCSSCGIHRDEYEQADQCCQPTKPGASAYQVGGDHYASKPIQPWDAMEAWLSPSEFAGFLRANAIKYLARAGTKGSALEDYRKAAHYLEKLVETLEGGE